MNRISLRVMIAIALFLVPAACGSGGEEVGASSAGPATPATTRDGARCIPRPGSPRPVDEGSAYTTGSIPVVTTPEKQTEEARAILRSDPQIAAAIASKGAELVWATRWTAEQETPRGVALFYEFARPVTLPNDVGEPKRSDAHQESDTVYDDKGLPELVPTRVPGQYEKVLSAEFAVDLIDKRLHYIIAADVHTFC